MRVDKTPLEDEACTVRVGPALAPRSAEAKEDRESSDSDGQGRRPRRRGKNRRRRPKRNDLSRTVVPEVAEGVVFLMTSKIYHTR